MLFSRKKKAVTVEQLHRQKILKNATISERYPRALTAIYTILGLSILYSNIIYNVLFVEHEDKGREELIAEYPQKNSPEWLVKKYELVKKEKAAIAAANNRDKNGSSE